MEGVSYLTDIGDEQDPIPDQKDNPKPLGKYCGICLNTLHKCSCFDQKINDHINQRAKEQAEISNYLNDHRYWSGIE